MKTNLILVFISLTLGTFACQNNTPAETLLNQETTKMDLAAEEAAIKTVIEKQVEAVNQSSFEGEAKVWAQEPYIMRIMSGKTGSRMISWDSIGTAYKNSFNQMAFTGFTVIHSNNHIRINGNSAWIVYDQHAEWTNDTGGKAAVESIEVRFLEKLNGQWKIVFQFSSPFPSEEE